MATGLETARQARLLTPVAQRETYAEFTARYQESSTKIGPELLAEIDASGLRGRGGAAFPLARKVQAVLASGEPCALVANGEEGEPASVKDRWLLRHRPHLVLDGVIRLSEAISAARTVVYVSDAAAARSVETALSERGDGAGGASRIELFTVDPSYVAGEETSAVRAINGGPALPTDKPPRPFESGVDGLPTLVSNVETLAHVSWIARHGAETFRELGTAGSPGTLMMTLSGSCRRPGLYEIPFGVTLGDAVEAAGGTDGTPRGFLMGGFFAGVLGPGALETALDYDVFRGLASGLGCGSVIVLGDDDCPVAAVADVMAYLAGQSARQCGACIRGTAAMSDVLAALCRGEAGDDQLAKVRGWSTSLLKRGACGLLDGAAGVAASLFREFPDEVDAHRGTPCPRCKPFVPQICSGKTRFAIAVDRLLEGMR